MIGASIPGAQHQRGSLCGIPRQERFEAWTMADLAFLAMTGKKPTEAEAGPLQILIGLLISNGVGTISAQGAKGAVSADGPETPERVQINKGMVGFLTHTGYTHGGNGFEGMAFLMEQFKDKVSPIRPTRTTGSTSRRWRARLPAPSAREGRGRSRAPAGQAPARRQPPGLQGQAGQSRSARALHRQGHGGARRIQCVPRLLQALVQALYDNGVRLTCSASTSMPSSRRCCSACSGSVSGRAAERGDLENAAFTVFLYGRMVGCAGEIDDHLNRGRNMDTRTPASACGSSRERQEVPPSADDDRERRLGQGSRPGRRPEAICEPPAVVEASLTRIGPRFL